VEFRKEVEFLTGRGGEVLQLLFLSYLSFDSRQHATHTSNAKR
jgi:hypothetical protein